MRLKSPRSSLTGQTTIIASGTLGDTNSISHSGNQTQVSVDSAVVAITPLLLRLGTTAQMVPLPLPFLLSLQRVECCSKPSKDRQKTRDLPSAVRSRLLSGSRVSRCPPLPSLPPHPLSTAPPPSESMLQTHRLNSLKCWTGGSMMAQTIHQTVKRTDDSSPTSEAPSEQGTFFTQNCHKGNASDFTLLQLLYSNCGI